MLGCSHIRGRMPTKGHHPDDWPIGGELYHTGDGQRIGAPRGGACRPAYAAALRNSQYTKHHIQL